MKNSITCYLMRGGTSKGGCFIASELPETIEKQDAMLCRIYGSNDSSGRQIDGIGGATSTTSKAVIIDKIADQHNTIAYTFCQVDTASHFVDRGGNCGNMSSVVGPFAIEMGYIDKICEPITTVKILNTNTNKIILSHVPIKDGKVVYQGDYTISGVPGTGAKLKLDFLQPGGAVTGQLLPTGQAQDQLYTQEYGCFTVSIVDAANPLVFIKAEDVGLTGCELPKQIDSQPVLLNKLLAIREAAAVKIGLAKDLQDAKLNCQAIPKFCFIAPAQSYLTTTNEQIETSQIDLVARMLSMGKLHPVLAITGAVCIGVAAKIPGTLVNQITTTTQKNSELRIGHCSGIITVSAEVTIEGNLIQAVSGSVFRTCRIIMKGEANID